MEYRYYFLTFSPVQNMHKLGSIGHRSHTTWGSSFVYQVWPYKKSGLSLGGQFTDFVHLKFGMRSGLMYRL
jgi:hypothetical protein